MLWAAGGPGRTLPALTARSPAIGASCPLFFARESDAAVAAMDRVAADPKVAAVLKDYPPFRKMLYKGQGAEVRALFDRANLPRKEQAIRNAIKRANLWVR